MKTATQRCPGCGANNDVSIFVSGQRVRCVSCDLPFIVRRSDSLPPKVAPELNAGRHRREPVAVPVAPRKQAERQKPVIHPHPAVMQQEAQQRARPKNQPLADQTKGTAQKVDTKPSAEQLLIPGFELFEVIGKGGMGKVYRARQVSLNRSVAIKVLNEDLAKHKSFIKRFEKETASLAAMNHPNISAIIDRGHHANAWYFVMEYIDGPSLRQKINAGKMDMVSLLDTFGVLCSAMAHAHRRGVIHRDLKPENILFTKDGVLKVVDFGLANILDDQRRWELTRTKVSMGTVNYMAPEQRRDAKHVDHRADIYSLGVMMYELLAGELPLGRFDPPSKHRSEVSSRLDKLALKMLDFEEDRRPQKVDFVIATLDKARQEYTSAAAPSMSGIRPEPVSPNMEYKEAEGKDEQDAIDKIALDSLSSVSSGPSSFIKPRRKHGLFRVLALLVSLVGLAALAIAFFWGMLSSDLASSDGDLVINNGDDGPIITVIFPQQVKHLPPASSKVQKSGIKAKFDFRPSRLPTMPVRLTRGTWVWDERAGKLLQDTCLDKLTINQRPALAAFGPPKSAQELTLVAGVKLGLSMTKPVDGKQPVDMQGFISNRFSQAHKLTLVDSVDRVGLGFVNAKGEGVQVVVPLRGGDGKVVRVGPGMELGDETFSVGSLGDLSKASHELRFELRDGRIRFGVDDQPLLNVLAGLPMGFRGSPAIACQNARCEFDTLEFSLATSSVKP